MRHKPISTKRILFLLVLLVGVGGIFASQFSSRLDTQRIKLAETSQVLTKFEPLKVDASDLQELKADSVTPLLAQASGKKWTIDELTGEYVHFYRTALTSGVDGGGTLTISKSPTAADTLIVNKFFGNTTPVLTMKLKFDYENQTISFPSQALHVNDGVYYGIDFCEIDTDLKPVRTRTWTSKIDADGTFGFNGLWGLVVHDGLYMNQPLGVYQSLFFARANGSIKAKVPDGDSYRMMDTPVFIWQPAENDIMVENFFNNAGAPVQMKLNHDHTTTIRSQFALSSSGSRLYTAMGQWDGSTLTAMSQTILTDKATTDNQITWSNWMLYTTTDEGKINYVGPITETSITLTSGKFNYPQLENSTFNGQGTSADPYKINNVEDLRLLSYLVSEAFDDKEAVANAFTDTYFTLTSDLDLTGVNLQTIGNAKTAFNGTFDGANHTITGLSHKISGNYVGLFGRTGEKSMIKNLTLNSPTIVTDGLYVGALVGYGKGDVENITINTPQLLTTAYGIGGVAGIGHNFTNCSVNNGQILSQYGFAGGIVAQCDNGEINDCRATEMTIGVGGTNMDSSTPSGGIAGHLNVGKMYDSYFTGVIANSDPLNPISIGGLAGFAKDGDIQRCFASGHISAGQADSKSNIGGLVGMLAGKLIDCYSTGRIDAKYSSHAGGITGYASSLTNGTEITNCFTAVSLDARVFKYDMEKEVRETLGAVADGADVKVTNMFYDSNITDYRSKTYNAASKTLASGTLPDGFSADVWTATAGQYPRLKKSAETADAQFSATAYEFAENNNILRVEKPFTVNLLGDTKASFYKKGEYSNEGHYAKLNGKTVEPGIVNGIDTLFITNGKRTYYHLVSVVPNTYEGEGTEASPYLIKTKEDMINISEATTDNGQKYSGVYFKVANDIDMEYDSRFKGIAACATANSFDGVFDGDGHTIHNLYLNGVYWTTRPEDAANGLGTAVSAQSKTTYGLFGRIGETGKLLNLNIADDADISLWSTSAAFVGENNGLVENCKNYAKIKAYFSWCAGIVGDNAVKGVIRGCFNAGEIYGGNMQSGGINGQNRGLIEECMNVGTVTLKQISTNTSASSYYSVGGITGRSYGGAVKNVVNTGVITGSKSVGGICGTLAATSATGATGNNAVLGAVSYGMVLSADIVKVGGIGGETGTKSTDSRAYYDKQLAPYEANGGSPLVGCAGLTTDKLTNGEALEGLDAEVWLFEKGVYPILKRFANEPAALSARKMVASIPNDGIITDLLEDVALPTASDIKASLASEGKSGFSINNGKLVVPANPKSLCVDTLYLASGIVVKPLTVTVYPVMPLNGEGTSEKPYLINTADDWNNLAGYTVLKSQNYENKYFSITADLDFAEKEFVPMSTNKDIPFQGTIDGGKHSLKNIDYTAPANTTYVGVFGYVGELAEITDLAIEGKISATGNYLGGFVGQLAGRLANCVNRATISSTKANIAGIAAYALGTAQFDECVNEGVVECTATTSQSYIGGIAADVKADAYFEKCANKGTIQAVKASYIGGIVGTAEAISLIDCYNSGKIMVTDSVNALYIGGILGNAKNSTKNKEYVITGCHNDSPIIGGGDLSGIVANTSNTTAGNVVFKMKDCVNNAPITSYKTTATGGATSGILGKYTAGSTIESCYNYGDITSNGAKSTGGIFGLKANATSATYPVLIKDCHNLGNIKAMGYHVSGVMGGEMSAVTIDSCSNTGNVTSVGHASNCYMVGGIASYASIKGTVIKNSYNMGDITVGLSQAGGIVATSTAQIDLDNCWNSGNIASTSTVSGTATAASNNIAGLVGKGGGIITNCHNNGMVTGLLQTGGLVGLPIKNVTTFTNCYNAGEIVSAENGCGGIIGVNPTTATTYWADGNTVENVYYANDKVTSTLPSVGTGVPYKMMLENGFGDLFLSLDNYSLPIAAAHKDNPAAHVASAQLVLADGDKMDLVTKPFKVGLPEKVEWSSTGDITFNDNDAKATSTGKMTITAKSGRFSKNYEIDVQVASSVDELDAGKVIVSKVYYTLNGQQVAEPTVKDGNVYIVVVTYDDNTTRTFKLLNAR